MQRTQQYLEIESLEPLKIGKLYDIKPKWTFAEGPKEGQEVDDEYLISENILPVYIVEDDSKNNLFYNVIYPDKSEFQLDQPNNRFVKTLQYNLKDEEEIYNDLKFRLDSKRDEQLFSNIEYTFPDTNNIGHIQPKSVENVKSLVLSAVIRKEENDETLFVFRDFENVNHSLTPQQIIDLGKFVESHQTDIYSKSWEFKLQFNDIYNDGSLDTLTKANNMLSFIESVSY
ncbi:MAG: hypothetical protein ACOC2W_04660 [bacterium]